MVHKICVSKSKNRIKTVLSTLLGGAGGTMKALNTLLPMWENAERNGSIFAIPVIHTTDIL